LASGADPNIMTISRVAHELIRMSSLQICTSNNLGKIGVELVELLLQAGSSTELLAYNTCGKYVYSSPLMNAIKNYSGTHVVAITKLLLDYGANTNYINLVGDDVLIFIDRYQTPENAAVLYKMIADALNAIV